MTGSVRLLRHPPVARRWTGRCYGQSDMGWSRAGAHLAATLVATLGGPVDHVVHSGLRRTRLLAERLARRHGATLAEDARWRERDFGAWEGRSWHAIWRETGDEMDRMMTEPATYRPGGGETGADLARRARAALAALPPDRAVLVVAHGGPIAALRCHAAGQPAENMAQFIPPCGTVVTLVGE